MLNDNKQNNQIECQMIAKKINKLKPNNNKQNKQIDNQIITSKIDKLVAK